MKRTISRPSVSSMSQPPGIGLSLTPNELMCAGTARGPRRRDPIWPSPYGVRMTRRFYPRGMTLIRCQTCGARNRVGPIDSGVPRCPKCKSELAWVVDADEDTFAAETNASVPVVVDFWAAWCGPCRMISPVLEQLAQKHAGHLKVVKVDVDANPGLATRFGARSIPLLVVIRDGHEVDRIVGALPRAALEQRLEPVLIA
jgi:thioredoxin 2